VRIDPNRVEAIQTLSLPRSRKEVQAFLGKINFLRRFISNFAETGETHHNHAQEREMK
jgi:hypothetical protein